jgi:hypothetical protein
MVLTFAAASAAASGPTVEPLANEPIIYTLEAENSAPAATLYMAPPPAPIATEAPERVGKVAEAPPTPIGKRRLALYAVVVASLLGVMVIAIALIASRDARRTRRVHAPHAHAPLAPTDRLRPPRFAAADPAWAREPETPPSPTFLS